MQWDEYNRITSSVCIIITSDQHEIHNVNYGEEFWVRTYCFKDWNETGGVAKVEAENFLYSY